MLEKIRQQGLDRYIEQFRDIRSVTGVVFVVIVLLVSWSGVKAIQANYNLQKQISELRQEVAVSQLKDTNLQLENEYYNTSQYLDLAARQNFGLGQPGEKELIVPRSVALANAGKLVKSTTDQATKKQPFYQRNFEAWMNFFLHRQQ